MDKKNFNITQEEWDLVQQQNYELKRELNRLTLLEKEYLSEIEVLQSNAGSGCTNLEGTIHALEQELKSLKQANNVRVDQLQSDLQNKDEEISRLIQELQSSGKNNVTIIDPAECEMLNDKIQSLEERNSDLVEENQVLQAELLELQGNIEICEDKIKNLTEQCQMVTESYSWKKQELDELKMRVEIMQDELFCTKSELDLLKSKPLESMSRGNSLFAEVDEKRVQLQTKLQHMVGHYEEMKRKIVQLEVQVYSLKHENLTLCNKWKKEIEERANDVYDIEDKYQKRVETLEKLIKDYETELATRPIVATKALKEEELEFIEYKIKSKNDEIERHLRAVNNYSLSNTLVLYQKKQTERELRLSNVKMVELQHELEDVKEELKTLKEKLEEQSEVGREMFPEVAKKEPKIKSALKCSNSVVVSEVKVVDVEMGKENRKVGFSEECKASDGLGRKYRGGKVYINTHVSVRDLKKKEF